MSLSLPCLVFAHLFPSGFHYGQDSSDKAVRTGNRERKKKVVETLPKSSLMRHMGKRRKQSDFFYMKATYFPNISYVILSFLSQSSKTTTPYQLFTKYNSASVFKTNSFKYYHTSRIIIINIFLVLNSVFPINHLWRD